MARRLKLYALGLGAIVLALIGSGALAHATVTGLTIGHKAAASADHTSVTVNISFTCTSGDAAQAFVLVLQGKSGTAGSVFAAPVACTGAPQSVALSRAS